MACRRFSASPSSTAGAVAAWLARLSSNQPSKLSGLSPVARALGGHLCQRGEGPDWDSTDLHAAVGYLHLRSRFGWCLSNVVVLLNLFTHRDLHA